MPKRDWIGKLAETNKELLLSFSIIAFAAVINFFVSGQQLILTFYNIPTLFAAYYFGKRRAVQTAVASILIVVWLNVLNPATLIFNRDRGITQVMGWADVAL